MTNLRILVPAIIRGTLARAHELKMEHFRYIEAEKKKAKVGIYATPKVTKYQRCNFIIQIHKFTIKIDTICINLLSECVKIVEFDFNSHVFLFMYQEIRFINQDACFSKSRCMPFKSRT